MNSARFRILKALFLAAISSAPGVGAEEVAQPKAGATQWVAGQTFHLNGYDVLLSQPILVAESRGRHMSMPVVTALANGDLVVVMTNHPDMLVYPNRGLASFSTDGGLTWTEPVAFQHNGSVSCRLPSGDELMLPFYLALKPDGSLAAPCNLIRKGERRLETSNAVEVTAWAEEVGSVIADNITVGGFGFDGQMVQLKNGHYFTTLYGGYKSGGVRLVGAESADGLHWKVIGTIAHRSGKVNERGEGPTEAALCRLKDGRLMCIYRVDSNISYGQTWSSDEGRSWTEPIECRGPGSVEPSLVALNDGGVLLSGGRPGVKLWLNQDGTGNDWQTIDLGEFRYKFLRNSSTTGYTELAVLDESHVICVYDYGREADLYPDKTQGPGYRIEAVRITLEKR